MNDNNHKGKLPKVLAPTNIAARLTITAFTDRPVHLESSADLSTTLKLFGAGMTILGNMIEQQAQTQGPVEDKERKLMGPREG
jgi:hypothetical protein